MGGIFLEIGWQIDDVDGLCKERGSEKKKREMLEGKRKVGKCLLTPNGHFLGQIPQPMQSSSEMKAILESGVTSMQSLPTCRAERCS